MLVITFAVVAMANRLPAFGAAAVELSHGRQASIVAEQLAARIAALNAELPPAVRAKCEDLLIDVVGLCLTARNEDYVKARSPAATTTGPAPRSATRAL